MAMATNAFHTMNTRMILPTFLSFTLLFACKGSQESTTSDSSGPKGQGSDATATAVFGGPADSDSLFFSLERTPCFGACKAYRLNIYRSGYATYEGRVNVEKEGMHSGRVGRDTMDIILREAERIGYYGLDDVYDSQVTDLPSTIIRIRANGKDKQVLGRVGTPPKFKAFTETLEELLLPVPWKPIVPQH
jgi:hypothetical protein